MFACIAVSAQQTSGVSITAKLLDETNGEALGFATVSLTRKGGDKPVKYVLSDDKGNVRLESVAKGEYTLKAELMGYIAYTKEIKVESKPIAVGDIRMKLDSEQLDAAKVSVAGNPITMKKDTIEFNAASFKTTENDVLEDLLKKLPGVEVSESGAITVNGETIKKITIEGKTFFLDDPQLASKNIPAKMVNKLKVIQKKSEQAEFTGIDDGQEETVLDLSVQPGMMKGLFGNVSAGAGADIPADAGRSSDLRYMGNGFVGKFTDKSQISLILNGNNVSNEGFSNFSGNRMAGMRGGGGGGGGGITTSYMGGVNGAWDLFDSKMKLGGNYLYNQSENDVLGNSIRTNYFTDYNLRYNSGSVSNTNSDGHRFGVRLEHKFSDNTSILFEPQVNFGTGNYIQTSRDTTYRDDLGGSGFSKLSDAYTNNSGSNRNVSTSGFFLFRQRLGLPGRTLTANIQYNVGRNRLDGINDNGTSSYNLNTGEEVASTLVKQSFENNQDEYSLSGRVTYTEPLGNHFYVEANYSYNWSKSVSDKQTYDLTSGGVLDYNYSNNITNLTRRQEIGMNVLYQDTGFRGQLGFSAIPTYTYNSTTRYNGEEYVPQVYEDNRWNFSPQAMISLEPNDNTDFRVFYRGNSSQPSTSQLMPVPDNSNPLNVSFGNPTLTPYFRHNFNGNYRYSIRQKFTSMNIRFNGGFVQNPIVNVSWNDAVSGGRYSIPFNGSATANAGLNLMGNLPVGKSDFSFNGSAGVNWSLSNNYVGSNIDMSTYDSDGYYAFMNEFIANFQDENYFNGHIIKNTTNNLSVNENLRLQYNANSVQVTLGQRTRMNKSWYSISTTKDQTTTFNNTVNGSVTWNWDWAGVSLKTDADYRWYEGYSTSQPSQFIWNAEVSKLLLDNKMSLSLRSSDILGQSRNISVSDTENYRMESSNNTLGRYVIVALTYRFGTMSRGGRSGRRNGGPGGPIVF